MLSLALEFICRELNQYLRQVEHLNLSPLDEACLLGDIARVTEGEDELLSEKLLISLIKIEEEQTMANRPHYTTDDNNVKYHNPPLYLNAYILFSSTFSDYNTSLKYLDEVLYFLQTNQVFATATHPSLDSRINKLLVEFFDPGFEHLNNIWGMLGGKAYPSACYRLRLLKVQPRSQQMGEVIDAIGLAENSL